MKISDINDGCVGKSAEVRGWIYRIRSSKNVVFMVVRDVTGIIQCTIRDSSPHFRESEKLLIESSVIVSGVVKKDERAPTGYEIEAEGLKIIHSSDVFPITKDKSTELLLDQKHLWVRSRKQTAVMKIKAGIMKAAREFLDDSGFIETTPPIITTSGVEGGSTLFEFKYFDSTAYLSQSAQLYQEALIFGLERVYAITPSFRAEKSRTVRHLAEYWHLEPEAAFVDHEENMKIQENLISYLCEKVSGMKGELKILELEGQPDYLSSIKPQFRRLDYNDAIKILQKNNSPIKWGDDLGTEDERILTEKEEKPIFVVNYPLEAKAFYMKENPADARTVLCADMLAPQGYGEIIGGSERETDYDKLVARLKKQNADLKNYQWYLDLRKYGSVPHSGFGLGVERFMRWILKLEHIRDAMPFPRVINRAYP